MPQLPAALRYQSPLLIRILKLKRECAGVGLGEIRGIRGVFTLFFPLATSAIERPKTPRHGLHRLKRGFCGIPGSLLPGWAGRTIFRAATSRRTPNGVAGNSDLIKHE
jgi:hypothetical protein